MSAAVKQYLDVRGLQCPMPLLKAKQALNKMSSGEVLQLDATDAGSWRDIHAYIEQSAHQLVKAQQQDGLYRYWIQCA